MKVRLLAMVLSLAAFQWGGAARAQNVPPNAPNSEQIRRNAVESQQDLARQFSEFQRRLQDLKNRLDRSPIVEDKNRAGQLQKVLDQADSAGIRVKFAELNDHLRKENFSLTDFQKASRLTHELAKDLSDLFDLFMNNNKLAEEIRAVLEALKHLERVIKDQERARVLTDLKKTDPKDLRDLQKDVIKDAKDLQQNINPGKPSDGQPGAGDPKDSKSEPKEGGKGDQSKSEAKPNNADKKEPSKSEPDKGDPKKDPGKGEPGKGEPGKGEPGKGDPSDGKGQPSEGEAKSGDPSDGQSGAKAPPGPPMPPMPGQPGGDDDASAKGDDGGGQAPPPGDEQEAPIAKKKVADAIEKMKKAEKKLKKEDNEGASRDQGDAIDDLNQAKKDLEKRLKALRDEELERMLANLKAQCELMLALQIEVLSGVEGTIPTYQAIQANSNRQPNDNNRQAALRLADKEKEIVELATKAIQILEGEGSGVAFPVAFQQLRQDMRNVQNRLGAIDVGPINQAIQKDIIATLKEMIDALSKKQQDMQQMPMDPMPPMPPMPPPDPKLLDKLAELKLIRSMQNRLNDRTEMYSRIFPGQEQPPALDVNTRREIGDLAERQETIYNITNKLQKGDNN